MIDIAVDEKDIYHGAKFICVMNHREQGQFTIGEEYTLVDKGTKTFTLIGNADSVATGNMSTWTSSHWDNGETWVEIIPSYKLSGEDIFAIRLAGIETVLGKRVSDCR